MKRLLYASTVALALSTAACASKPKAAAPAPAAAAATSASAPAATPAPAVKAAPEKAHAAPAGAVTCTHGKDTRILEIEALQPNGCKVWYTKAGKRTEMAASPKGTEFCKSKVDKIKGNLASAKFECHE